MAIFLGILLNILASPGNAVAAGTDSRADTVLERFRTYTGPRTKEALSELFRLPANPVVRQQPAIAISDGTTAVMIAVRIPSADGTAPNFAVEGAKLLSLESKQRDEWLIKALPPLGALHVFLLVANGPETSTFPLTVAPPLPKKLDATSQSFSSFLEADTNGPLYDLNGDGKLDYIDDYIYTANVVSLERESGRDLKARRERALKRTLNQSTTIPRQGN